MPRDYLKNGIDDMDLSCKFLLCVLCFLPVITLADNSLSTNKNNYSIGLNIGSFIVTNPGGSASFPLGFSTFNYSPNKNTDYAYTAGISFNKIVMLSNLYSAQVGASYHYLTNMNATGSLLQGISAPYYQAN